jgi:isopentenyl-diphosphate delta-isomerase
MPEESETEQRKAEHVDIILKEKVEAEHNFWNDVHLIHESLPEVDYEGIDISTKLFGRKLNAPIVIASMTGGFEAAKEINTNLAKAAAEVGVALGVGSQRAALEHPELEDTYSVVKDYEVPLRFANIGAPQLVEQEGKGSYGFEEAQLAMRMVGAHVLLVHMNFLQEVVQPEGDKRAKGCLSAIQRLALRLPVVAKETGAGVSRSMAVELKTAGVIGIDVGGLGGTSFSAVEYYRARKEGQEMKERLGATFWNWGIPTPASVVMARTGLPVIATGGVRSGLDVARAICLGASAAGLAKPMLEAAKQSADAVVKELQLIIEELKTTMFLSGCANLNDLTGAQCIVTRPTSDWMEVG